jgi:putative DNA primase/helicase
VATAPTRTLENRLNKEHERALEQHEKDMRAYEADVRAAKKTSVDPGPPPRKPEAKRVAINDTTIEALVPILKSNPRGLLLERDELVGWVKSMDMYRSGGKGSDRQFWLSTWSNRPVSVDRKAQQGEPLSVLRPFVAALGGIQPTVLPELAANREDGMLERFLLTFPKPLNAEWSDDEISEKAERDYADLHARLRRLAVHTDDLGDPVEVEVGFSPDAKQAFIQAYNEHRREMAEPDFPSYLRSPWAKLEAYLLRLALILAACRFVRDSRAPERIEADDVLRAVTLLGYFKAQSWRVFGALREADPLAPLMRDVLRFVRDEHGGLWTGSATELHEALESDHKPERPDELSKFVIKGADLVGLLVTRDSERYRDEESGESKVRRILTLYLPQLV